MNNVQKIRVVVVIFLTWVPVYINSTVVPHQVNITLVRNAKALGAYCLDGSLPAYHLDRGFGAGARNWLLQFEVDIQETEYGSGRLLYSQDISSMPSNLELTHDSRNISDLGYNGVYRPVIEAGISSRSSDYKEHVPNTYFEGVDEPIRQLSEILSRSNNIPDEDDDEFEEEEFLEIDHESENDGKNDQTGGGWCNDIESCLKRAKTHRGSSRYMKKLATFSGILGNNASLNPDFYNWNRVKIRYCDGASFAGDDMFYNGTSVLYFRGQKIWKAVILDLVPKGLGNATKALLSGCSAGGLASYLHCDNFASYLPSNTSVKCLGDAGFFLDAPDMTSNHTFRSFYASLVSLQGVEKNLNSNCRRSIYPKQCFFPQYALNYINTPFFVLNSAYDVFQFHHILVPPSADPHGHWNPCKNNPAACNATQINILQGFRTEMLSALLKFYKNSTRGGVYINSCFAHCQSESQDTWLAPNSPRVHNKTISQAVGDWYFGRRLTKEIDCPYPCDSTCHNLIGPNNGL